LKELDRLKADSLYRSQASTFRQNSELRQNQVNQMNVKRYRAATMRDALEKIKGELGDEALVLGSKAVRSKGFLGLGAKNFVEVRVSTEFSGAKPHGAPERESVGRQSRFFSLNLNDSSPAIPGPSAARDRSDGPMAATLTARANAAELYKTGQKRMAGPTARHTKEPETSRISPEDVVAVTTAPEKNKAPMAFTELSDLPAANSSPRRDALMAELELLHAEVREVKFTLTRPAHINQNVIEGARSLPEFSDADSEIYDSPFYEIYLHLASLGLQPDLCRAAVRTIIDAGDKAKNIEDLARIGLIKVLPSFIRFGELPTATAADSGHSITALIGPTGVGKTTTIAKLAARAALRDHRRVELITLDTYRIAAVEQLKTYAEIIGAGFHVPRSVLELDALIQRFDGKATVLIDTIGRSARDLADQLELADYLREKNDIVKSLVIQATTHPTDALLAMDKFALFGANSLVITKLDETSRPSAAIATAAGTTLPLAYLCSGQRVPEDIEKATPQLLASHALQATAHAMAA
jgi:flagellar biosynthesis protein FlhF